MQLKRGLLSCAFTAIAVVVMTTNAWAHAISIGFENAGPGSVNIWLGTYQHGGHHLEGSLQLEGVSVVFGPVIEPFDMLTATGEQFKPAGLIDGVTNFYVQGGGGVPNDLPLVPTQDSWLAQFPGLPANHWQGVNFSGLAAGVYKFTWIPAPSPSQEWSPWSSAMNGTFDLSGVVEPPPVPEPASVVLFGLGVAAMAIRRRRSRLE